VNVIRLQALRAKYKSENEENIDNPSKVHTSQYYTFFIRTPKLDDAFTSDVLNFLAFKALCSYVVCSYKNKK